MQVIYIEGEPYTDDAVRVPLSSAALLFVLRYCQTDLFHVNFVKPSSGPVDSDWSRSEPVSEKESTSDEAGLVLSCLVSGLSLSFISSSDVPEDVKNCALPVIQNPGSNLIRCGLCCCVRYIIRESHRTKPTDNLLDLLGFRAGSLKACAEVSGWTKLCELELPGSITTLINNWSSEENTTTAVIPEDLMKLELHFEKPAPLHNDDKVKRAIVKDIQSRKDVICDRNKDFETVITEFFGRYEDHRPHGNIYYRIITKNEQEKRKFVVGLNKENSACKYGCTEDKLVRWCAKCNDREKLRQKERQIERNLARLKISSERNHTNSIDLKEIDKSGSLGVSCLEELGNYIDDLTLNEIEYDHQYAEGITLTVADLLLYTYMYSMLKSVPKLGSQLLKYLPHVKKWLQHLVTLPRIQHTSCLSGFNMADLTWCLEEENLSSDETIVFHIPKVSLDVEGRRARGKHKALKNEVARVLKITQEANLVPSVGSHPRGSNIHVSWDTVPGEAHPKTELPEKRVGKKCEQLENLATAVESLARPGDVIVDFCSGGGHLGIIIAYLLPQCKVYLVENKEESFIKPCKHVHICKTNTLDKKVYLVENKEESLMRAKHRVDKLKMTNLVLYQCNLDYFEGHFDIGVCLHACGVATDMVLQQCLERNAAFVICPCCYGSIRNTHLITYPRSQCYRETSLSDKDVIILGHAADQTEFAAPLVSQGRLCMNLVDTDRALVARENGYHVTLCSLQPLTCTPKNNLLVGKPPLWCQT